MRLARWLAFVLVTGLAAGAEPTWSHPGHGPVTINVGLYAYQPQAVNVVVGDGVFWIWGGVDRNHSVTSDTGAFDSDPGRSAADINHPLNDSFGELFTTPGTFSYHCKVHPFMTGTVVVA